MSKIRLRILGESVIQVGETLVEPSATHVFALLLYLAIERGRLISRSQLASMLFAEGSVADPGHNLRQLLYRLRRLGVPLEATAAAVRLPADCVIESPETVTTRHNDDSPQHQPTGLVLLPNYTPPSASLSRWLEEYRDEISSRFLRSLASDLARARGGADWAAVERLARALLDLDPLNESATLGLAEALARNGSKHKAVKLLRDFADDVGRSHASLALPSRLLTRRISEESPAGSLSSTRPPFVGRAAELRLLTEAWSHARRGHCAIAVVTGEDSIGKSRVLEELVELVRMDGSGVALMTHTQPNDCHRPMSLFADICGTLLAVPGAAGCSPDSIPHLRRLQGAPSLASQTVRTDIDPFLPEGATRLAIVDLLDSVSSERPLLLCVDDADDLDDSSRELLSALPIFGPTFPILVVAAGNRLSLLPPRREMTIRLRPLSAPAARDIATWMSEHTTGSPKHAAIEWCVDTAAGNPGHLEILMRHAGTLHDAPVAPRGLISMLDSRLGALPPASRHVLQSCLLFGADCCPATISALTGLTGYQLLTCLEQLVEEGFVSENDGGIVCRSSLLAERVRHSTTPIVRKLLHRRAATFLEESNHASWTSQAVAWRIAAHWQEAGSPAQALKWRRACWRHLLSIGQPFAAAESIRGYLQLASTDRQRAGLLDELILALQHASDVNGQLAALVERLALCDGLGDGPETRHRLAADLVDARLLNHEDTTSLLPLLHSLVACDELDEARRLRTARILMIAADQLFDDTLGRSVYAAMPKKTQSQTATLLRDQVAIIYHTVFGSRDEAHILAQNLNARLKSVELSPASISAQLTASLALHIVSSERADTTILELLFERCLAASMSNALLRIGTKIACFNFDVGEIDAAMHWCQRATHFGEQGGVSRLGADNLTLRIDLALLRGDVATAHKLIDAASQHFPISASPRVEREHLVYRTIVAQHADRIPTPHTDIEQLLYWHDRAKHLSRHDDHMQALWTALWRAGRREEASKLLRDYLLFSRRERRPASFSLQSRTIEDPFWGEINPSGLRCSARRFAESLATGSAR